MLKEQVASSLKWLAIARFSGQLVTWVSTVVVMRLLAPSDYGLVAMAMIPIGLAHLLESGGMGAALIQRENLEREMIEKIFAFLLWFNLALCAVMFMAGPLVAAFFGEPQLAPILRVLSLQFPIMALSTVPDSMLRREMRFRDKSIAVLVSTLAHAATTFTLAWTGFGVWALVLGQLAASATLAAGLNVAYRRIHRPRFELKEMRAALSFGGLVTAERLMWYAYSRSDVFIIGKIMGKELLGFYSVAMQLATLPMQKIGGMMNEVGFAAFSRIQNDKQQFASHFIKAIGILGFFAFPTFFGISSVAPEIVTVVLGERWLAAIKPLQILSLVVPLRMISTATSPALLGAGHAGVSLINLIYACIIMPTAFWIGTQWGLSGVAWAWCAAYPIQFLIVIYRSMPYLGVRFKDHLTVLVWPAMGAAVMYAAVVATRMGLTNVPLPGPAHLGLLISAGAISYLSVMFVFQRDAFKEVLALVRT